VSKKTAMDREV
jgi:flagellar biosynthesis chaperone FliJ